MEWAEPRSAQVWDELVAETKRPNAIPLVPFVGAGMSAPSGYKLWSGFLTGLAAECGLTKPIRARLASGEYEEAAEDVEAGLGRQNFVDSVRHEYGCTKPIQGAVRLLPKIARGPVITTNFDRVLEAVFEQDPFEDIVWGSQVDRIAAATRGNRRFLLKLHGDAHERTNRVLTKAEYDEHYTPHPHALPAQLEQIYARTLLFLGCSLGPDRTLGVLEKLARNHQGMHHYALLERPATDEEFHERQRRMGNCNIRVLWYPHGKHEAIESILEELAQALPPDLRAPKLALLPALRQFAGQTPAKELDLLIPHFRITDLAGRDADLASLHQWLSTPRAISVRVLTGQGGAGKTRLALELMLEKEKQGWHAGWLTEAELTRFPGVQSLAAWTWQRPTLAVIDYAGTLGEPLRRWLQELVANPARNGGPPLRLLLLEREASAKSGWMADLFGAGFSTAGVRDLFDPPEPVRLAALGETADRRAILRRTLERAAALLQVPPPRVPAAGEGALFDARLASDTWRDPLALMMAAIASMPDGLAEALSLSRTGLALRLAEREQSRLLRFDSSELGRRLLPHLVAFATACGGLGRHRLVQAARDECQALGFDYPGGPGLLAERACAAWPSQDGTGPIQPDIVAEAFLLRFLPREAVVRAAAVERRGVARSVMRTVQDFGARGHGEPFDWLDALVRKAEAEDFILLLALEDALPHKTVALRERAVAISLSIAGRLAALVEGMGEAAPEESRSRLARIRNNLCVRLSDVGRRAEALEAAEEAVRLRRQLAQSKPDVYLPDLAMSVGNVANRLSDVGRRAEALESAQEAVRLYRQLAQSKPDVYLPNLAMSVNNVALRLSDVGRRAEALEVAQEAVRLYRQLAQSNPDAFLPDLATSANNVAKMLSDVGRQAEALEAAQEAVRLYEQLAQSNPNAFLPDLAMSLNNVANVLGGVGRQAEALGAAQEAVRLRRQLAQWNRDAFLPDLAMSLNNVAIRLSEAGRRAEALEAAQEAVRLRRQLAQSDPDAFLPDLAMSIGVHGHCLMAAEQPAEAAAALAEAIRTLTPFAESNPGGFGPLACALAQLYFAAVQAAGLEPDLELLAPLLPLLGQDQAGAAGAG